MLEKAELTLCRKVAEDLLEAPLPVQQQPPGTIPTSTLPPVPLGSSSVDPLPSLDSRGNAPSLLQPGISTEPAVAPLTLLQHHSQVTLAAEGSTVLPTVGPDHPYAVHHGTTISAPAEASSALQSCLVSSLGPALLGSLTTEGTSSIGTLTQHIASALPSGLAPVPLPSSVEVIIGPSSAAVAAEGQAPASSGHPEDAVVAMVHQTCLEPVQEADELQTDTTIHASMPLQQ